MHSLSPYLTAAFNAGERTLNRITNVLPGVSVTLLLIGLSGLLAGCAPGKYTYHVEDGGGIASYYTYQPLHPDGRVVSMWDADDHYRPVRRYRTYKHRHVPVDQSKLDAMIPHEFSKIVSSRGPTKWGDIRKMCKESRPGYCDKPNVGHCHGPFCHAHPGGDVKHTH